MQYGLYRDGSLKKVYDTQVKAAIAKAVASDVKPECKWEIKPIKKPPQV
jgi:hypothetical protein